MAKKKKSIRTLKYKTINKTGEAPGAGTTGHQKDTIFVKQVTDTTFTPIVTDMNGKALELEKPQSGASTFREILEEGNYIPGAISFLPENNDSKDTSNTGNPAGALGIDATTYTYHFGKFNPNTTAYYGVQMGYNALANNTGQSNTAVGAFALENNTTGEYNVAYGYFAGNKLTAGTRNTFIGINAGKVVTEANGLTMIGSNTGGANLVSNRFKLKDVTDVCPVFGEHFNRINDNVKVTKYGWNATDQTITSIGTYIGAGAGEYGPDRCLGSVLITNDDLNGLVWRNYNNNLQINFSRLWKNTQIWNSYIAGSFLNLRGTIDNVFAIHYGKNSYTDYNKALLFGKFDEREFHINGKLTLNPAHAPAVNNTFTKVAIANDNGDLTFLTLGQLKALLESVTPEPLNV